MFESNQNSQELCDDDNEKQAPISIPNIYSTRMVVKQTGTLKAIQNYFPFIYRINDGFSTNYILMSVCKERGWREFTEKDLTSLGGDVIGWNLWWRCSVLRRNPYKTLYSWQYTNHIANCFSFCRKSALAQYFRIMKRKYGAMYDFIPDSFVIPGEFALFQQEHKRRSLGEAQCARNVTATFDANNNINTNVPIWISKPIGKSQGKGIYIFKEISAFPHMSPCVLQEYITRPLLIGGYKFDLRLYVCVVSTKPLTFYLYREGLARFATTKYDLSDTGCCFSHLTNSSLNKYGPGYQEDKELIGAGCKWTLKQLREFFVKSNWPDWILWQRIVSMINLTIVGEAAEAEFHSSKNCFDFFGFDILIDENFRPWLLEVNMSPGLGGDCTVDEVVKRPMLHDLFNLLGFPNCSEYVQMVQRPDLATEETPNNEELDAFDLKETAARKEVIRPKTTCTSRPSASSSLSKKDSVSSKRAAANRRCKDSSRGIFESLNLDTSSRKIIERLYSMTVVYGQNPSPYLQDLQHLQFKMKSQLSRPSTAKTTMTCDKIVSTTESTAEFWKTMPGAKKGGSLVPHRPGIGIRHRNWHNPIKSEGDWIRIFPFDSAIAIHQSALHGKRYLLVQQMINKVDTFFKTASDLVKEFPNESDEFYNKKILHRISNFNSDVWLPPC